MSGARGYTNWELSADRANAARRALLEGGLDAAKISRVVGLASAVLFNKQDPLDPINRRISIIVMTKKAEAAALVHRCAGSCRRRLRRRHCRIQGPQRQRHRADAAPTAAGPLAAHGARRRSRAQAPWVRQ